MTAGLQALIEKDNDITIAIHRFRDNESTYVAYLKKFLVDPTYEQFKFCMTSNDFEHAKNYCSALNGLASNLGLTNISKLVSALSTHLSQNNIEEIDVIEDLMNTLEHNYNETISLIDLV